MADFSYFSAFWIETLIPPEIYSNFGNRNLLQWPCVQPNPLSLPHSSCFKFKTYSRTQFSLVRHIPPSSISCLAPLMHPELLSWRAGHLFNCHWTINRSSRTVFLKINLINHKFKIKIKEIEYIFDISTLYPPGIGGIWKSLTSRGPCFFIHSLILEAMMPLK